MVQNKARLAYTCRTQPSEVERMPYWEYELYLKSMSNIIEEENKRNEEAEKGKSNQTPNMNSYQRQAQRNMSVPKMPRMPSFNKMPKI